MKVLLVNPFQVKLVARKGRIYNRTWTPLDLAYTAAVLRQDGHEVKILDANAERLGPDEVAPHGRGMDKVFITSTSLDRWQCPHLDIEPFLATVAALRAANPELYVLGSHGTVKPEEMLATTQARAIVRGEPEITVRDVCRGLPLAEIRGVTFPEGGAVRSTPDQKGVKMDELPLPALDLLPMHLYQYEVIGDRFTLFEMSRGCASTCTFCLLKTYGPGVRRKSTERVIAELEDAYRNHGVRTAYFIDLEFTILRKQVIELCQWLVAQKLDFTWCCQTRFDLVDEELLTWMKRAGCTLIHFGVEAGSDRMLELVDKGITMAKIREGMRLVKRVGIQTATFFMMGFPESTEQDMKDIVAFARELRPDYPLFHIAAPYPGTRMYEQVKHDPKLRFSDQSLFPEAVEGRFTVQELKAMTRKAYLSYYASPVAIARRLLRGDFKQMFRQAKLFLNFVRS